jgi:ankyrin repeat protein
MVHRLPLCLALAAIVAQTVALADRAAAQVPPSAAEIAAYRGLHAAAASGDLPALTKALQHGADINARDGHGRTALLVAAHGSHRDIVQELARAGADMKAKDAQRYDIITIAAVRDDVAMLKLAIVLGADPAAITSPYDGTALIAAAHLGHAESVRALIAAKAPLDHVNNLGWTAVMEAVVLGDGGKRHQDTLRALVEAGADVAIADRAGVTALEHARRRGYAAMVTLLGG